MVTVALTDDISYDGSPGQQSLRQVYAIWGTKDLTEARAALWQHLRDNGAETVIVSGVPWGLDRISFQSDQKGSRSFEATIVYSLRKFILYDVNVPHYATSGASQTVRRIYGLQVTDVAGVGASPTDFGTGVNYNDGVFEGADIIVGSTTEIVSINIPASDFTFSFRSVLQRMQGTTNSMVWRGYAPGEVLFESWDTSELWVTDRNDNNPLLCMATTFRFLCQPNVSNWPLPGIGSINKGGWDYTWVFSRREADPTSNRMISRPASAYSVRFYDQSDFNILGF